MHDTIKNDVLELNEELIALRRDFHKHPELSTKEIRTSKAIVKYLKKLGLVVITGVAKTGVIGLLKTGSPGKTLMLRADMDALPIEEKNDITYCSINKGVMHACAHDGHIAILLIVAKILAAKKEQLSGQIKFIFQPAEELVIGAAAMIKEKVLENPKVDVVIGLHLKSPLPTGTIHLKSGPIMAAADTFKIKIIGKTGHAGYPHSGVDAILMSAQVITALQSIVAKEISSVNPLVVHVGSINGGYAENIIADEVILKGTVRTFDPNIRDSIPEIMDRIISGTVTALKGTHELTYKMGPPAVVNTADITRRVKKAATETVGQNAIFESEMVMGAEDFAYYLNEVPGCFFFIGAGNHPLELNLPHHNSRFNINEQALAIGAEALIRTTLKFLNKSN
jgi:amidohydrolase